MLRRINIYAFCFGVLSSVLVYVLFEVKCLSSCNIDVIKPLFWGLIGIIPALSLLLFFSEQVFISWLKYVVWWVVLMGLWAVTNNENENDFSPFANDITIIGTLAVILFVITLVYALIMNARLKKNV